MCFIQINLYLFFIGVCINSIIDKNYYLSSHEGSIYYEGYKNTQWKKVGENWTTSDRLSFTDNEAFIEMNPADNHNKYPVGIFTGDVYDPIG